MFAGDSAFMLKCLVLGLPYSSGGAVTSLGFELFLFFCKTYSGIETRGELRYSGNYSIAMSYILNSI